ncbi:E3 ubiquitin-protein ligase rnf213-alpha-like [Mercenaria mercenaria]|uniref:E3 ubiquitin-protein ligase rnf213-alpha-like n=1 Tax=Mercenaria mercenaria TaxID=6596 RepID=UPI00234E5764|nr:E3 ubiquitin-protein ligase rnf213-alpha-like [Mercenaria mercenaria]
MGTLQDQHDEQYKETDAVVNDSTGSPKAGHTSRQEGAMSEGSQDKLNDSHTVGASIDENANFCTNKEGVSQSAGSEHFEKNEDIVDNKKVEHSDAHEEMELSDEWEDTESLKDSSESKRSSQKRKHGGGGSKGKTAKKRGRKKRNHPERYGLSADAINAASISERSGRVEGNQEVGRKLSTPSTQKQEEKKELSPDKGDNLTSDANSLLKNSMAIDLSSDIKVFGGSKNTCSPPDGVGTSDIKYPPDASKLATFFKPLTTPGQTPSNTENVASGEEIPGHVPTETQDSCAGEQTQRNKTDSPAEKETKTNTEEHNDNAKKDGKQASEPSNLEERKKDKDAQNRVSKDSKQAKNKNVQSNKLTSDGRVLVRFNVLVSEDFHLADGDKVVVRIDLPEYNGWDNLNHVLKKVGQMSNYLMMEVDLKIKKTDLSRRLRYKYGIVRSSPKDPKKAFTYENHHVKNGYDSHHNRTLHITESVVQTIKDTWHQYDGIISPKPNDSIFKRGYKWFKGSYEKECQRDAEKFAKLYCPIWFKVDDGNLEENISVEESVLKLECLFLGLRKAYYIDVGCWDNEDGFNKTFSRCILSPVIEQLQTIEYKSGTFNIAFLKALTIVIVCEKVRLVLPMEDLQIVCRCLLVHENKDSTECVEMKIVKQTFTDPKILLEPLKYLIQNVTAVRKNPSWMFCLPLFHFISGICEPFDIPGKDKTHSAKKPVWWGTNDILDGLRKFKAASGNWDLPLREVLECLEPLFAMDFYLPRSIVASLTRAEVKEVIEMRIVPVEISSAAVYYYQTRLPKYPSYFSEDEKILNECKTLLLQELQEYFLPDKMSEKQIESDTVHWWLAYNIALDLSENVIDRCYSKEGFITAAHVFLHCASIYDQVQTNQQYDHITVVTNFERNIWSWLDRKYCHSWYYTSDMDSNFTAWNMLFVLELQSETVRNLWNDFFKEKFDTVLTNEICRSSTLMSYFVKLYCEKNNTYKYPLQVCLNPVAFKAIEKGYNIDMGGLKERGKKVFGELLSDMFVKEWLRFCPNRQEETNIKIFMFSITWSAFEHFVRKFYTDQSLKEILTESCWDKLTMAIAITKSYVEVLDTGDINVGILRKLHQNLDTFASLVEEMYPDKKDMKEWVLKALHIRNIEIDSFLCQAKQMSFLTELCAHVSSVDTKDVETVIQKSHNIERYVMTEFCKPCIVSDVTHVEGFKPALCAFSVSEECLHSLPELEHFHRSSVCLAFWHNMCRDKSTDQFTTIEAVVTKIWFPVRQRIRKFVSSVRNGNIFFQEMELWVGKIFKNDSKAMVEELKVLGLTEFEARKRIEQLTQYRKLGSCVQGAKIILGFVEQYGLKGNFKPIFDIAQHHNRDFAMSSFDGKLMDACAFLEEVTPKKADCLDAFVQSGALVTWLKETMSKLKELKVFVDLAFMSAGDVPMNIKKVQCLHSAVTGYAPLIFDLEQKAGHIELLDRCKIVWKELDANENLPVQLVDTCKELQWLKDVKKAHVSVEVTSLVQADAINECGIYSVGKPTLKQKKNSSQIHGDISQAAEKAMILTVREREGEGQRKQYSFTQLQDLQSRLMLVAGKAEKGNDSVERFTMIFDGITRLCNVYTKLCEAGCVLFKDWSARCFCDHRRAVPMFLKFGNGDQFPVIECGRSTSEDLKDMIPHVAKFMENCLEEWLEHIKVMRSKYIHLNYFTVDQLVILQRELVKVGTEDQPTYKLYPLLSAVKTNCSPEDVIDAMSSTIAEVNNMTEMNEETAGDMENTDANELDTRTAIDEKRENFIHEVVQTGYSEALAIKALEHVAPEDIAQGIVWCMDNEDTEMLNGVEQSDEPRKENIEMNVPQTQFGGWCLSEESVQSMITSNISRLAQKREEGVTPFINDLSRLWRQFLESISSNLKDYLSLEHLGLILSYLSRKDTRTFDRTLPPGLLEGQPNLIICRSGDILLNTLAFYMMDENQPLPQADEILLCTKGTSKDEVEIFWRRAIFEGGRKIHCLLNADLLDFDVSEAAGHILGEYVKDTDLKYRLLVVCGSDNEYRSSLVSSLDKYRRQSLPVNVRHLRAYLADKLSVQYHSISGIRPAAHVDSDRSSVRVIKSWRAGVGKTLFKKRKSEQLNLYSNTAKAKEVSIPLHEKTIDMYYVTQRLLEHTKQPGESAARLFHFDVSHEVQYGVDYLLFNLIILGCLVDKTGFVWRKSHIDIYLIEAMPLLTHAVERRGELSRYVHPMLDILPDLTCRSPVESLMIYYGRIPEDFKETDQLFDDKQFRSPVFQRTFRYLLRLDISRQDEGIRPKKVNGNPKTCLQTLLRHCGIKDPSWSELHHFVSFFNTQLVDFEQNNFVSAAAAEDLPGFSDFVLRFLIQMSRDFSTRSLNISEQSPTVTQVHSKNEEDLHLANDDHVAEDETLLQYHMRRTWESSPHPYLFFNSDRFTFTFLGFFIDRATGNLVDQQTGDVLEQSIMNRKLYDSLLRNHAPIQENFDDLPRDKKIMKLCNVMGIEFPHDPDDTYELTTDNVKKILAIYMRFRCNIPVIIMGETGCGKTRLIKFMCALQMPPGLPVTNIILMKVHGGTTSQDIINKVHEAEKVAKKNRKKYGNNMYTVLFFDEANTTEAIGLIKEIMCDRSMEGEILELCENLKMVAACNPYRKHSDELIKKLEQAGLGYHVDADETTDRLGRVPMRRLVYRVQPLPQSVLPLVWDFGQLETDVEDLYIRQMVRRYIRNDMLPDMPGLIAVVSTILTASQLHMREQKDECSFVSLRDVDRVLTVMSWFYEKSEGERTLFDLMDAKLNRERNTSASDDESETEVELNLEHEEEENSDDEWNNENSDGIEDITRSLVLALGVCYHACLKNRNEYREYIAQFFRAPCQISGGAEQIRREIECCQDVFLDHVQLEDNIARNMALKENVFMMVVCIELRIPLFLVGKPGSSKSLAKTIVSDAMQGNAARKALFREMKQAQMVSFQCSPLSTPDGIVGTFRQCAQFQKDKDLDTFVSIVVLDEVGLAEDSPRMPLKTLHPLLEDGCQGDEKPEKYRKVAFIGISNWALDPAKMNRGILVQREIPDQEELKNSAIGICQTKENFDYLIKPLIEPMAVSYLEVFKKASDEKREFFGLRDFYSLVKMVFRFVEKSRKKPTWHEMVHAIKRNFGGLDEVDPIETFRKNLTTIVYDAKPRKNDPDCSPVGLIQACLFDTNNMYSESRYLLLLTENFGTLTIIQQLILSRGSDIRPITIFGSSFRSDQEYTQVCRNINKIKICMETGNTVVLLNLENLYESLYDALNQYYVYFGGERYVDLGLGTHRVKCPVHKRFRLIVVAEKQTVYEKFPIPLINRLEKHFLTINTMLTTEQQNLVKKLESWTKQFIMQTKTRVLHRDKTSTTRLGDVFIGYHDDTCSSVILCVCEKEESLIDREDQVMHAAKSVLLWCATPDSVLRLRNSSLPDEEQQMLTEIYFKTQAHDSLLQYLDQKIVQQQCQRLFSQVTTHSKLLAGVHKSEISSTTKIPSGQILLLESLSSFDTEQQFSGRIHQHLQNTCGGASLMVIQCDSGDINGNLIACARYCVMDELERMRDDIRATVHIVFIIQLSRKAQFRGFQCGMWNSVHIDDLFPESRHKLTIQDMQGKSVANLFTESVGGAASAEDMMEWVDDGHLPWQASTSASSKDSRTSVEHDVNEGRSQRKDVSIKELIMSCVQAALSVVKDKEENSKRETDRVALVLKLLHNEDEGDTSFVQGVCRLIAKLLKEKETKTNIATLAQDWLILEAADLDNISKTGTLRRSCSQILESKVSPIFAGVIAFLDTNNNLSIMQDEDRWKRDLWLSFLNAPEALNLHWRRAFKSLCTTLNKPCLLIFDFSTALLLKLFTRRQCDALLDTMQSILCLFLILLGEADVAKLEISVRALRNLPLSEVLINVLQQNTHEAVVADYIHDFIHCVYHAASEAEHKFVCKVITKAAFCMPRTVTDAHILNALVCVHLVFQKLSSRLVNFRAINSVWPECSTAITEVETKNPDHFMFSGGDFTFSALCLLVENLSPSKSELDQPVGRAVWLNKVHRYRPVVEKIISVYDEDKNIVEANSIQCAYRAKRLWSRITIVKLFLEHVCASDRKEKITIKYCMPLWKILGEETDMKEIGSFEGVEKFLKVCNRSAIKEYIGAEVKCSQCNTAVEGTPVKLPCNDVLCDECYEDMRALGDCECASCHQHFQEGFPIERLAFKNDAHEKLRDYQKKCNTFFMDVVSQLCFSGETAPSRDVVEKLLGYVFFTTKKERQCTKDLSVFGTGIDPTPVFRSFLLQLLMKTSEETVKENLETYLRQAQRLICRGNEQNKDNHHVELSLLVIQCLEDMFIQIKTRDPLNAHQYVTRALQIARQTIEASDLGVEKLYGIAYARMGLAEAATHIAHIVLHQIEPRSVPVCVRKVIEAAQILCEDTKVRWARIYLVKCICRCHGVDVYQKICRSRVPFLRWIPITDIDRTQVVEVSDRYIVCGEPYIKIREALTKVALGEDVALLDETVQELHAAEIRVEPLLQLAIHREITGSYLYPQKRRKVTPQAFETIDGFIDGCKIVKNKAFGHAIVQNRLLPLHLSYGEGDDLRTQGIVSLIVHFMSTLSHLEGDRTLLQPLMALMRKPQALANAFLPTMPQDDLQDVKDALLAARHNVVGADDNPVFYRCPNGHPYVIGDCGRPATVAICKECGSAIGGQGYHLRPGNVLDHGGDNTMTGHILGRSENRGRGPKTERTLTPAQCSTIRLILHVAMYVGSGINLQGVCSLIRPDIEEARVGEFVWRHIARDIDDIQHSLGRSVDDALLYVHSIIDHILKTHDGGERVRGEVSGLTSKRGRNQWETEFSARFLQTTLQNIDNELKAFNQCLAKDKRLGADPLLCLLYETDDSPKMEISKAPEENSSKVMDIPRLWKYKTPVPKHGMHKTGNAENDSLEEIQNVPRVWRYRTPVSLQHLRQELDAKIGGAQQKLNYKVLQLFLKEENYLRALRYIPSILRLHRALLNKYQKKLDKAEAAQITIAQLKKDAVLGMETELILQDFTDAWELVRESLQHYVCPTDLGGMSVPKEYCVNSMNDKTTVAMLLPTTKEGGLCSYALLDFLMRKQNDFLHNYLKETQREASSVSCIAPNDVTSAHLICYDPHRDILPLILANCQYSFEMGKGTKIEYDFGGLERQIMDRFLFSKSRIDVGRVLQIDMMVYRTEFTNTEVFKKLAEKIPQICLTTAEKTRICSELKTLPEICQSLDNLDITVSFLKTTGGNPDENLHEFMTETLQMDLSLHSQKARQVCQFQHAQSLWLLLSLQKSKKMTDSEQHSLSTFECVTQEFHDEVPKELLLDLRKFIGKLTVVKQSQFVEVLHEFIILVVSERQNRDDEEFLTTTENRLGEWLYGYVDGMENPALDVAVFVDFPKELLYRHSVKTWIAAYKITREKRSSKRT